MAKYRISAGPREGFDTYFRGGPAGAKYAWPRQSTGNQLVDGRLVELLDQEDDQGEKDGALRLGTKTFEALRKDPNVRIVPDGEQGDPGLKAQVTRLQGRIAELEGQNEALKARAVAAEHELESLRSSSKKGK